MGCDIHFFVEKKSTQFKRQESLNKIFEESDPLPDDKWELVSRDDDDFYGSRNYALFGTLADVRRTPKNGPISEPRGFPDDTSEDLNIIYKGWGWDAHTPSYFSLTELINVDWTKYDDVHINEFMNAIEKMKKIDQNTDNVRCVFWFDN
jgi:hypothetical protein